MAYQLSTIGTYDAGTVTVTTGSTTVTGSGTVWRDIVNAGDILTLDDSKLYFIAAVVSDTELTLDKPFEGASQVGAAYRVILNTAAHFPSDTAAKVQKALATLISEKTARSLFLAIDGEAESAKSATTAKNAERDGEGNIIKETYATKAEDAEKLPLSGGTMTGEIRTNRNSLAIMKNTNVSISDTSRTSVFYDRPFGVNDKDDKRGAAFEVTWNSNGNRSANIIMRDRKDSKYISAGLVETANGRYYFQCGGSEALLPVGAVFPFASNTAPAGCLLCNGAAVSRATYAALFAAIGTTYGAGDGSTTFNLPNLTDRFIQGSGTAGTVKNAGLPNIYGGSPDSIIRGGGTGESSSGLITMSSGSYAEIPTSGGSYIEGSYIIINAAKANAIYGNSDTVQPPALTMRYYIKY